MSNEIRKVFEKAKKEKRAVFIPFFTAAFPNSLDTVPLLLAAEKGGADIIELGVPFSDPLADGPTIQYSNTISLQQGTKYEDCLRFVKEARDKGLKVPIVLMGYINPLMKYGETKAIQHAHQAGVNGIIVVDLPLEEKESQLVAACREYGISYIPLIAPTSRDERIPMLVNAADSFIYCVSVAGITGSRNDLPPHLPAFVQRVRSFTNLPLAVGFGISTRDHFAAVEKIADGVVIGSAIIQLLRNTSDNERSTALEKYIQQVMGR